MALQYEQTSCSDNAVITKDPKIQRLSANWQVSETELTHMSK